MCGICGELSIRERPSAARLRGALDTLRARGPDDCGTAEDGAVAVGHTRLAIRGGASARQPCRLDGGQGLLVYNGELYNTAELQKELRSPASDDGGDSQLLAHWLAQGGDLGRLAGIFAFAWWRPEAQELLLVRDRLGVKPLYYAATPCGLAFASSPRAIAAMPGFAAAPDTGELWHALIATPRVHGPTAWRGIQAVPPGCMARVDAATGAVQLERYALPHPVESFPSEEAHAEALASGLRDAVRRQMVSNRPVCVSLSGGLDSSLVAALAAELGVRTTGFTADWDEQRDAEAGYFEGSDGEAAAEVARHLALPWRRVPVSSRVTEERVLRAIRSKSSPLSHTTELALDDLYEVISASGFAVALTGEGADELWHGYAFFDRASPGVVPWATVSLADACDVLSPEALERESVRDRLEEEARRYRDMPLADAVVAGFLPYLLERLDAFSMAHSVEARVPFLDERVLPLSFPSSPYQGARQKSVLRCVASALLPASITHRKKSAFPASRSAESWALTLGALRARVESGRSRVARWLRDDWSAALEAKRSFSGRVLAWRLLNLDLWLESLDGAAVSGAAQEIVT